MIDQMNLVALFSRRFRPLPLHSLKTLIKKTFLKNILHKKTTSSKIIKCAPSKHRKKLFIPSKNIKLKTFCNSIKNFL